MEESQVQISDTPRGMSNVSGNRSSYDSADSGYLTLTPQSANYTPVLSGCRFKSTLSTSLKRHHRLRLDPWQSDRSNWRYRNSKVHHLLNCSSSEASCCDTPSGESSGTGSGQRLDFGALDESREYEFSRDFGVGRRNYGTAVPKTPGDSSLHPLSPPPSPAIPSLSFVASEPIEEEDVEMKLVILQHSTPQEPTINITSPPQTCSNNSSSTSDIKNNNNNNYVAKSPIGRRKTPLITSEDNRKLSKLCISELVGIKDHKVIKPKRLDFSQRAAVTNCFSSKKYRRATQDYTGKERVDLLSLLGEKSNHWRIVSKILGYLSPQDLCSVSMVSTAWRRLCASDIKANTRRLSHIILRQNAKENWKIMKKAKVDNELQSSPKTRFARKGYLMEVQNFLQVRGVNQAPNSPPVSPSKVKFHSFVKASRTLAPWEHLLACPRCTFPCLVDVEKNVGTCTREGCCMEFCVTCSSKSHTGPCKTPLLATPTKRNKRLVVGSRQSKRNLRRL